jgi:tetratricopeptide (TPR) repeat protein
MRPGHRYRLWAWLAIVVILGLLWPVQLSSYYNPVKAKYRSGWIYRKSSDVAGSYGGPLAGEPATLALLAGFRSIARTLLWIKVDELWHGGRWYRMLPVMVAITRVDPHFITVWETFGWHLAWNMNAAAKDNSMQAGRDIEIAARSLHQAMLDATASGLPKPVAKDLAEAQGEVEDATRELDESYTDEKRLKQALSTLRGALEHLTYAWGAAAEALGDRQAAAAATDAAADILGSAERLVRSRREEQHWIHEGIAIDEAGIRANPDRYEMYWELAWLYFDRVKEYHQAEKQLLLTIKEFPANAPKPKSGPEPSRAPFYVYHSLAHCYEYQLEVDKAIAMWKRIQREVPNHPVPVVPKRSLKELETYGNDPAWGVIMIQREERIRKGRLLPPWHYTSPQGRAALAWWQKNKDNPEAIQRVETLQQKLREPAPEETTPKRRLERDEPHPQPAGNTS